MMEYKIKYKRFKDLEREILNAKMNLRVAEAELEKLIKLAGPQDAKAIDYTKIVSAPQFTSDKEQLKQIAIHKRLVDIYTEYVEALEYEKDIYLEGIDKLRKTCSTLELEVFYRHHIKRQSLNAISQELKYGYGYIRQINMKIIDKIKNTNNKNEQKTNSIFENTVV